ncbi:MAG: hypothetical protein K2K89_11830 [Ruminococcus sp.]|nr:hypothetical protein [Ruminococcus sp.]
MHKMYAPFKIGSEFAIAKITIEEFGSDKIAAKKRLYNLQDIKIEPLNDLSLTEQNQLHLSVINDSSISISYLVKLVKTYDKNFFENPNAVGRDEREAELYLQAEYNDAVAETEGNNTHSEKSELLENVADSRNITKEKAEEVLQQKAEKLAVKRPVSMSERKKILNDFAEKNGLGKIDIWRKSGNPITWRIAETENGERTFNEQLCTIEKGENLSKDKLMKSLDEFEKSDFFIQYKQKKTESISETEKTSDNQPEYPFVSVKAGWNYDKYISPELEQKNYTVPEFNDALKKLSERWDNEEYETKSAFVTLTIHISETESFEKRLNAEYQFKTLSERLEYETDWTDTETELRKAIKIAENNALTSELTEKEKAFLNGDIEAFMAKAVLSWDEIEDLGYPLYEKGYSERFSPSKTAVYGNGMSETKLYDIANRMHSGDDIRKELSMSLLGNQSTFITTKDNIFNVEYGEDFITAKYGNVERQISYEDIGNAFLNLIESEHNDIVHDRTVDDLQYVLHDLSSESAENLLTAFDNAAKPDWENSRQEQQQIKSALYDILDNEEQAEKAFESIAKWKYNFESIKEDSLEFHFGNGKDDDWISESNMVHDFALANPDCSFALGNAILEYLDEKQHTERNIPELKAGWYKKTGFDITATVGGENFHYEGRFDIGDGKGTGGGSLLDHIRNFNQGIMDYSGNTPEAKEQAKNTLEILVPFLEKNSVLTEKEKEILEEFKAANPIRSYEDIEKEAPQKNRENSEEEIIPDVPHIVSIGDKFRSKTTGEISEIVSLTGALPWYTDDCTVKRESGGFAITKNISYDELLDPNRYEYIGNAELSAEKLQQENQQYINTIKNLNQLKNTLTVGTEFEITDHIRPECIGQAKRITSVNTVGFTTQVIDKDGNPDGRDVHMEWSKAKNWNFKNGQCNAFLENGEKLMSFKVRKNEAVEMEKPVQQAVPETMQSQEKPPVQKSVDDLKVGDVIKFDGGVWRISDIQDDFSASLENTDKNAMFQSRAIWGNWKESLEREGFEYVPVKDVIEQGLYEKQSKAEKQRNDFISNGQMSMFGDVPDIEESPDKVIQQSEPEGEQLEMFHIEENRPYQVITYDSDNLSDDKEDFSTLKEAQKRAKEYLKDNYEGYAIYNKDTQTIEETSGYFPTEKIFSVDVLLKNGVITPEQEPEMIKNLMEKEIHDKVISELLKSENLKTAAKNNTRDDFSFSFYEAVNNTLIEMLDSNSRYAAKKEITYLLDDEEYLHNVFKDYDTILKQFIPEKTNEEHKENQPDKIFRPHIQAEKLYNKFTEMFPDIASGEHTHERYGNVGDALEPLSVEHLGGNTYAFMTYFIQNGDVMRDPDFEFELDHENKTLNITEYRIVKNVIQQNRA